MHEELLTIQDLTQRLKISRRQLERLRHEGLPCVMIKSTPRFEYSAVLNWLKKTKEAPAETLDYEFS